MTTESRTESKASIVIALRNPANRTLAIMQALLVALLACAAEVFVQPAPVAASNPEYINGQRGLRQAGSVGSNLEQRRVSDGIVDNYAIIGNVNHRQLQHGAHPAPALKFCSVCKIHFTTPSSGYRKGHCKINNMRYTCIKQDSSTSLFSASADLPGMSAAASSAVAVSNSTSSPKASGKEELVMLVQVNGANTSSLLAGVRCFNHADCELSANALAPLDGKSPMSRGGVVAAECLGAVREVPGICTCAYTDGTGKGGAAAKARNAAGTASGSGQRRMLKRMSQSTQEVKTVVSKFDICIRRSSMKSFSIVTESMGNPRLVNSTASGNITLDVDLVEVKQNVPQDDVAIKDIEPNALVILRSATPFSANELGEYDDAAPVSVSDADPDSPVSIPVPSNASSPSPFTANIPRKVVTNARAPAPARALAAPPSRPPPQEETTGTEPVQSPNPATSDDAPMRGRMRGANNRLIISEEFDVMMRLYGA